MIAWPLARPLYPLLRSTGAADEARSMFMPEVGEPIARPRTTARTETWAMAVMIESREDLETFEAWVADELGQGAMPFVWRHPVSTSVTRWRLTGSPPYGISAVATDVFEVSFQAMRLPGIPWYAPYVPDGTLRLPAVVADYANDVFGIEGQRVATSAVAAVAGTFDVWTYPTSGTVTIETSHAVTAGDIPAAAPVGVSKIVAYAP